MAESDAAYARLAQFYDLATSQLDDDWDLYDGFAQRGDAPVLELGAGTGRVALELARRGHTVVGIDSSPEMLAIAGRHAAAGRLSNLSLLQVDMCESLPNGSFGLIFCALNGFMHLLTQHDQLAVLRGARARLAPAGRLVLDLPGPASELSDWEPGARPFVLDRSLPGPAGEVMRLLGYRADLAAQIQEVTDIFEQTGPDGSVRRTGASYRLRYIFPAELELLLLVAGLQLDARYGDYELGPFNVDSFRMVAVASLP